MPTQTRIGVLSCTQPVDRLQVSGIGHDDQERLTVPTERHEAVAQHQVGRNAAEQRVIDVEVIEIDELEEALIAGRQPA